MEMKLEFVLSMDHGVDYLQLVKVIKQSFFISFTTISITVIDCKAPPTPLNGQVEFSETLFTSRANYSCNNGYILNGSPVRLCTDTGLWSGPDPICKGRLYNLI